MAVDKLVDSGQLDGYFTNIANAIRYKYDEAGDPDALDYAYTPTEMPQAIEDIPTGGGGKEVEEKDVNFYDYDGTLVDSYTAAEFAALSAMPANPTHAGLTAQGWNWNITDAKSYVSDYGRLDIGQMYITDDGKSRIYIHLEENQLHPYFGLGLLGSVEVDWGDGSPTDILTGNATDMANANYIDHQYDAPGDYVITVTTNGVNYAFTGDMSIFSQSILRRSATASYSDELFNPVIKKIEMGERAYIRKYAFYKCLSMETITIPDHVDIIPTNAFYFCYILKEVVIPDSVSTIQGSAFANCYNLAHTLIPPNAMTLGDSMYMNNPNLKSAILPYGLDKIPASAFNGCHALEEVVIPETVTSMGNNPFANCYVLKKVTLPDGITQITNSAFSTCYALVEVEIPDSVSSIIQSAFTSCYGLMSIHIPDGVKGITKYVFQKCYSLESVTIPSSVIKIDTYAFADCTSMKEYHLKPTTPPTLTATNAFNGIPANCVIYVPAGSLSAYQSATNWSTYASKMQEE